MACNVRCILIVLCVIQIIALVEKQVFDFLCLLWTPVLLNILHTLLTVIALAGICRYIHKILILYSIWCLIWTAWNIFVICFFYEVGVLNRTLPIMNLGCNKFNWFPGKLLGCSKTFDDSMNSTMQNLSTVTYPATSTIEMELMFHFSTDPLTENEETDFVNETFLSEPEFATLPAFSENWDDLTDILNIPTTLSDSLSSSVKSVSDGDSYEYDSYDISNQSLVLLQSVSEVEDTSKPFVPISYRDLQGINAIIQCILAIFCFILTCILAHIYSEEEDSSCLESQPVRRDELEYVKMRIKESTSPSSFSSPPASSTLPAIGTRAAWRQMSSSSSASYMPKARPLSERVISRNYGRPIDSIDLHQFNDEIEQSDECHINDMGEIKFRLPNCNRPKSELYNK